MNSPSEADFRACGYTAAAINFPLSDAAFAVKCARNGITPDKAPRTWRFAPNDYVREEQEQAAYQGTTEFRPRATWVERT